VKFLKRICDLVVFLRETVVSGICAGGSGIGDFLLLRDTGLLLGGFFGFIFFKGMGTRKVSFSRVLLLLDCSGGGFWGVSALIMLSFQLEGFSRGTGGYDSV